MADSIGIPPVWADDSKTCWETSLDAFSSNDHDLLWFFKKSGEANFSEVMTSRRSSAGAWTTEIFFNTETPNWEYEVKARAIDGHLITDVSTGNFTVLIVINELETQIEAIRNALVAIGQGKTPQSYSIRGRSLSQYGLTELTDLYNLLKRELAAQRKQKKQNFGYLHGNFGYVPTTQYQDPRSSPQP